ncbi:hypothetical protein [Geodermatophilus sp. SYSU D00710]
MGRADREGRVVTAGGAGAPPGLADGSVDFDLHGFVGIRLLDARTRDLAVVTRQIGPLGRPLDREPDITIRFVDELPEPRRTTYAGWPETGAADGVFHLLRGRGGVAGRTRLPMDDVGGRCEIVCERRVGPVPHLLAVINMTALAKGVLPLHASAFSHRGAGVLATGWAKGGKTEALLALAARGARYIGDEWVYLTPDGAMYGLPEPIRLWHWHVAQLPALRAGLPTSTRARLRVLPTVARAAAAMGDAGRGPSASVLRRAAPVVRRQAHVQVPPARLFGDDAVELQGRLDHVLLVMSHDRDEVSIEPIPGAAVAAHMRASLEDERSQFLAVYRQFRFLFPDRRSAVVEQASAIERDLLERLLGGRPAHLLRHPYPIDLDSLVGPIESVLSGQDVAAPAGEGLSAPASGPSVRRP